MGLFDFVKDAGARMMGTFEGAGDEEAQATAIGEEIKKSGFDVRRLDIFLTNGKATVKGIVESQEIREKVVLLIGNTKGVGQVDDQMTVEAKEKTPPAPPAKFYTVQKGDTLSGIAKTEYGDPMKYNFIFDANRPMLSDPNKIYPGQVLRIPTAS